LAKAVGMSHSAIANKLKELCINTKNGQMSDTSSAIWVNEKKLVMSASDEGTGPAHFFFTLNFDRLSVSFDCAAVSGYWLPRKQLLHRRAMR